MRGLGILGVAGARRPRDDAAGAGTPFCVYGKGRFMKVGIIGFARSGKTTVFNSLTGARAEVGAFGSREANLAVLKVPDERIDRLAEIYTPKKITYAEFQFVDIAPDEAAGERRPETLCAEPLRRLRCAGARRRLPTKCDNPLAKWMRCGSGRSRRSRSTT